MSDYNNLNKDSDNIYFKMICESLRQFELLYRLQRVLRKLILITKMPGSESDFQIVSKLAKHNVGIREIDDLFNDLSVQLGFTSQPHVPPYIALQLINAIDDCQRSRLKYEELRFFLFDKEGLSKWIKENGVRLNFTLPFVPQNKQSNTDWVRTLKKDLKRIYITPIGERITKNVKESRETKKNLLALNKSKLKRKRIINMIEKIMQGKKVKTNISFKKASFPYEKILLPWRDGEEIDSLKVVALIEADLGFKKDIFS